MTQYIPVNYTPTDKGEVYQHNRTFVPQPQKVSGAGKLGMRLLGVLLRDKRGDSGTVNTSGGTILPEVFDTGAHSLSSLRALAAIALSDAVNQLKASDSFEADTPLDEQLSSANVLSVSYTDSQDHIDITIQVVPVSGAATQLTIPTR